MTKIAYCMLIHRHSGATHSHLRKYSVTEQKLYLTLNYGIVRLDLIRHHIHHNNHLIIA